MGICSECGEPLPSASSKRRRFHDECGRLRNIRLTSERRSAASSIQRQRDGLCDRGGLPALPDASFAAMMIEEVHHSLKIEGSSTKVVHVKDAMLGLAKPDDVAAFEWAELVGLIDAVRWVYSQRICPPSDEPLMTLEDVHRVHALTVGRAWALRSPSVMSIETPGRFRKCSVSIGSTIHKQVPYMMDLWVASHDGVTTVAEVAALHQQFERIHPYADGNGRTGRALASLALVRLGFPPLLVKASDKTRYLGGLTADTSKALAHLFEQRVSDGFSAISVAQA